MRPKEGIPTSTPASGKTVRSNALKHLEACWWLARREMPVQGGHVFTNVVLSYEDCQRFHINCGACYGISITRDALYRVRDVGILQAGGSIVVDLDGAQYLIIGTKYWKISRGWLKRSCSRVRKTILPCCSLWSFASSPISSPFDLSVPLIRRKIWRSRTNFAGNPRTDPGAQAVASIQYPRHLPVLPSAQ